MPLTELNEDQVRTMSAAEKDAWWLANVYRGDMPQLTLRAAVTGMLLGAVLSLSNLYIGVKVGAAFGVALTAVVLAFTTFKLLSRIGLGSEFTVLENNCMQSIASSAGYMTSALISTLPAYMAVTSKIVPQWQAVCWIIAVALLGVLFAFPMKRRFINDEQLLFPEGRAAGVLMHSLHTDAPGEGWLKGKILAIGGGLAALLTALQSQPLVERIFARASKFAVRVPSMADDLLGRLFGAFNVTPTIAGSTLPQLGIRMGIDFTILAVGGLLGIQIGLSFLVGAVLMFAVLGPEMVARGEILSENGGLTFPIRQTWAIWPGVAMLTTASLYSFFSGWRTILAPFQRLFARRRGPAADPLAHIELPMRLFVVGIPVVGAIVIWLAYAFFGVSPYLGALAIPLVFVLTLIGANTTGQTGQTPSGALGKLTQLTFAAVAPGSISTNIMTAGIASDTAINASSLLQDIKPGYMLGAKPRHQVIGHVLGIFAGAIPVTFVFYKVFLPTWLEKGSTSDVPLPAAGVAQKVAQILTEGLSSVPNSALIAAAVFGVLGILFEMGRRRWRGRFPLHPIGIGFACVIPFEYSILLFAGAFAGWLSAKTFRHPGLFRKIFAENRETICAAVITGSSITGILVAMYEGGFFQ